MLRGYRSELSSRGCHNIVEAFQHSCLDFFQLLARVAIFHVGDCDAQPMGVVI